MANILLIEPDYKNKYPPIGLMKIATYHKIKGDNVIFYKGKNKDIKNCIWDRIYISTLFTFYWDKTVDTIKYYYNSVRKSKDIFIGGVMATLMHEQLRCIFDITIIQGLLNVSGILGEDEIIVDTLPADYSIIDQNINTDLNYNYPTSDSYIVYATRGCIRKCKFCAVPILEPQFDGYIDIKQQVDYIKNNFGEKKNLLLLDNNVLASKSFEKIIDDIKLLKFHKGSYFEYNNGNKIIKAKRSVDFNQGIDARLLTSKKCELLSSIAIDPLRIAFDHVDKKFVNLYIEKVRMAAEFGIKNLSNYILFNFNDKPEDLYYRLEINIKLNNEFKKKGMSTRIWSFPMKYCPIFGENCTNRRFIGPSWNKKYLRAIQCILNATHGVVGHNAEFFYKAFGANIEEFFYILSMPEEYIMNRKEHESDGSVLLWKQSFDLNSIENSRIIDIIKNNEFNSDNISNLLEFYRV